jgi:hypothetical protein
MSFFKRKKPAEDPERWQGWPDGLDVKDGADVEWIKRSNDPLVWHAATLACLLFQGDQHGLLPWLARQPALDRVTAAAMFLHGDNGLSHLEGGHLNCVRMTETPVVEMIDILCDLDGTRTLSDNGIGMAAGWESARLDAVARLADNQRAPMRILAHPIDRQVAKMPYTDIGEGDIVSRKFMRENFPYLLD